MLKHMLWHPSCSHRWTQAEYCLGSHSPAVHWLVASQRLVPGKASVLSARWPLPWGFFSLSGGENPHGGWSPPRPFVSTVRLSCGFPAMSVSRHKILVSKLASPLAFSQTPELQSCTHGQMQRWSDFFPPLKPYLVISVELKIYILKWDICCRNLNIIRKTLAMSLMVWILSLLFPCGICCHLRWGDCLL